MNYKESRSYNGIEYAKKKMKKAKEDYEVSITDMKKLVNFIEENIKVDGTKNLNDQVKNQISQIKESNTNLDNLIKRMDKHKEKIKEISKLREEAEKFGN